METHLASAPSRPGAKESSPLAGLSVVITHTSFALYWPARLARLAARLAAEGGRLHAIEVTADPGPYSFADRDRAGGGGGARQLFGAAEMGSLSPKSVAGRLWEALDETRPDVVVSGAIAFTPGATAVRWCRSRRRGVVVMDDARDVDVPRSGLVNAVKRRFYANVDAALIPAPSHGPTYEGFGVPPSRLFYGVDVVDNEFFAAQAAAHRRSMTRSAAGHPLPERFFLGAGRQVTKKNWSTLLRAYARYRAAAAAADRPWALVLVGNGPDRAALVEGARARAVPDVHFLPFMQPDALAAAYAWAGCVVLPSLYGETWGLVINEAMACGAPVLVSEQCGCAEALVEPGGNGWTFPPDSEEQLAAALTRMTAIDDATRAKMGDRSRALIAHWGLDRFTDGACAAIRAAATGGRRGLASMTDRLVLGYWRGRYRTT